MNTKLTGNLKKALPIILIGLVFGFLSLTKPVFAGALSAEWLVKPSISGAPSTLPIMNASKVGNIGNTNTFGEPGLAILINKFNPNRLNAPGQPDLSITKTNISTPPVEIGDTFTWRVVVENFGVIDAISFAAGDVVYSDTLPDGATYSDFSAGFLTTPFLNLNCGIVGNFASCVAEAPGVTLNPGQGFIVDITVTPIQTGSLINTAYVDPGRIVIAEPFVNSSTDIVNVLPMPDLSITKTNNAPNPLDVGDTFKWTVVVINTGGDAVFAADELVYSDQLPAGATYGGFNGFPGGLNLDCGIEGNIAFCKAMAGGATLANGQGFTIEINATPTLAGSLENTAIVDPGQNVDEVDEENNSATDTVLVENELDPSIEVIKEVSVDNGVSWQDANTAPGPLLPTGLNPRFRFTVTNTGNVTLSGITLADTSVTTFYQSNLTTACTIPASLTSAGSFICYGTFTREVGQHTNTATTTGLFNATEYSDTDPAYYYGNSGLYDPLTGVKTLNAAGLPELEWRMVWFNNLNDTSVFAQISDPIKTGTTYVVDSLTCEVRGSSTTTSCTYDSITNKVIWVGTIGPDLGHITEGTANNEVVITFRVVVDNSINRVNNTGLSVVDTDGDKSFEDETALTSESETNESIWNRSQIIVDPKVVKSVSPSEIYYGYTATYTLVVTNVGSGVNSNVVVVDTVSSFLNIQQVTTTRGTAIYSGKKATFTIGTVNPGDTITLTIKVVHNGTATVTVDIPNYGVLSHNSYGIAGSENSNSVLLRIQGGKTLPNTGQEDLPEKNTNWIIFILSVILLNGLFAFGIYRWIPKNIKSKSRSNFFMKKFFAGLTYLCLILFFCFGVVLLNSYFNWATIFQNYFLLGSKPVAIRMNFIWLSFILVVSLINGLFGWGMVRWIKKNAILKGHSGSNILMKNFFGGISYLSLGIGLILGTIFVTNSISINSAQRVETLDNGDKTVLLSSGERVVILGSAPEAEESMPEYSIPLPDQQVMDSTGLLNAMAATDKSPVKHINIPAIGVDTNVDYIPFEGNTWSLIGLKQQVAWLGETSWPGLGSNTVLAAHVSLSHGVRGPFYFLEKLKSGDEILVTTEQNTYVYVYNKTSVVNPLDTYVTDPTESPQLTLITCTDWDPNNFTYSKRVVINASLASVAPVEHSQVLTFNN